MNINFNLAYLAMTSKQQEKHMPPQTSVLTKEKKKFKCQRTITFCGLCKGNNDKKIQLLNNKRN